MMTEDTITQEQIELVEAMLGYDIFVDGERAGAIEGVPGQLEYIEIELHWEGQGVARAAIRKFVEMSISHGEMEIEVTNATHDAAQHILETEDGFEPADGGGWVYRRGDEAD